ncbi:Chalcone synthase J [Cyphellophora attinorum]|uniref:Chalcone synthase J n=1 Tax=Cyphellophora attinorum TaxID=1664694 RepID=A0A0N1HGD1_9EURO|nr:Chalcone synthase J [Phialophora attinorum]KPI45205.1 Chalcone synthase J [Phialophora attinorum]
MSPSVIPPRTRASERYQRPNVFVYGVGAAYPPHSIKPEELDVLARRFYPSTPALEKVLTINAYTGIDTRASIGTIDHPVVNDPLPPSITELNDLFMTHGVSLSVSAARKALAQSNTPYSDITHVVSTTCTNSANPGFDHYVIKKLGLRQNVQKVLLHGIGCSGGMAALRTAAGLIMGESFRGRKARVLVLAAEISTTLVRSELESIVKNDEVRIGICLFSDCASALVVGNEMEGDEDFPESAENAQELPNGLHNGFDQDDDSLQERIQESRRQNGENEPILELLGWEHEIIEDTEKDLGFDVDPLGWKVVLTPRVPKLTAGILPPLFSKLVTSIPELKATIAEAAHSIPPTSFSWALHPGGATILSGVERVMGLNPEEHLRESYEIYVSRGNSSSATWASVVARMMNVNTQEGDEKKRYVLGCGFGPGISVEMAVLKRLDLDGEGVTGRVKARKTNEANGDGLMNGLQALDISDRGSSTSRSSDAGGDSTGGSGTGSGNGSGSLSPNLSTVALPLAEDVD